MRLLFSAKKGGGQNAHLSAHGAEVVNCPPPAKTEWKEKTPERVFLF